MSRRIIVAGGDALGLATAERLVAAGTDVTMICTPPEAAASAHEMKRLGVEVVVGSARLDGELDAAGIRSAAALVLTADDDATNVDAALTAARLRPDLPTVLRAFDANVARYLAASVPSVTVLSMSIVAAPVFVDLARTALAAARPPASPPRRRPTRSRSRLDRVVGAVAALMAATVIAGTLFFAHALDRSVVDAFYFVATAMVGYGDDPLSGAGAGLKLAGIVLLFAGATFVAIAYALLTGAVVARRMEILQGRVAVRGSGHVVIVGAGNIGFRVAQRLVEAGHRVVVVERDGDLRNVSDLRARGHHVIVADATAEETLALAGAASASVVIALTDSDTVNLGIALRVRDYTSPPAVVLRVLSPELARHVAERGDAHVASPVAIASREFARAALAACENAGQPAPRGAAGGPR